MAGDRTSARRLLDEAHVITTSVDDLPAMLAVLQAVLLAQAKKSATAALGPSRFDAEFKAGTNYRRDAALGLALGESAHIAVESHVRGILNKLGLNSRAQIAGWMATSDQ